jgi:hypothetical protein
MPDTWASNEPTVAAAYPVSGMNRPIGSSSRSSPSSRHCITSRAVIVLVIEPIRNCVSGSAPAPADPHQTSSSPLSTPAMSEGSRRSAW